MVINVITELLRFWTLDSSRNWTQVSIYQSDDITWYHSPICHDQAGLVMTTTMTLWTRPLGGDQNVWQFLLFLLWQVITFFFEEATKVQ